MNKKRILVLASGSADGGGSGFENLIWSTMTGILDAKIVAVVTNNISGGVSKIAARYGIEKIDIPDSIDIKDSKSKETIKFYQLLCRHAKADFIMLSGWLFKIPANICGSNVINIHPGPMRKGIDKGRYGLHVHQSVLDAFHQKLITHTAMSMHIVDPIYDNGKKIFSFPVAIIKGDTADSIATRVNTIERAWQSYILNCYIHKIQIPIFAGI